MQPDASVLSVAAMALPSGISFPEGTNWQEQWFKKFIFKKALF